MYKKRRSSTNPFVLLIFKNPTFCALLLTIFIVWVGAPRNRHVVASSAVEMAQDSNSNLVESDHYLYAAIYSVRGTSSSTLGLNNAMMTSGRVVRVTLYNKAGERFALPEITLAPSETRFLDIRESIPPERIGTFSEGSVEVYSS